MNMRRKLIVLLAIATLVSIVNASVFVYYPINLTIRPQEPPVVFESGSNAGQRDLWGGIITVNIGDGGTSLSIEVHPTLQRNYYYDIVKIKNNDDNNAYYLKFRVITPISDERVSAAYLIIGGDYSKKIDLMQDTLQPDEWFTLSAGSELRVDLYLVLTGYTGGDITVKVDLIYSTTNTETNTEVPPEPPT